MVFAHPFIKLSLKTDGNGDPIQMRRDSEPYNQEIERLSEEEFAALLPTLQQPFRLLKDRLFRIRLFEVREKRYLFTDFHHMIFDGSSMLVMIKDLERAYLGGELEKETYSGFEVAQDEQEKRKESYEEARKWYLDTFGGIEVDSLPIPDRNEKEMSFGAQSMELALEASEVEA